MIFLLHWYICPINVLVIVYSLYGRGVKSAHVKVLISRVYYYIITLAGFFEANIDLMEIWFEAVGFRRQTLFYDSRLDLKPSSLIKLVCLMAKVKLSSPLDTICCCRPRLLEYSNYQSVIHYINT